MGSWIKIKNNNGNTIALKQLSGFDRYFDHKKLEDITPTLIFPQLSLTQRSLVYKTPHELLVSTIPNANPNSGWTTTTPSVSGVPGMQFVPGCYFAPSIASMRHYFDRLEATGSAVLTQPNSLKRMVSVMTPPEFNRYTANPVSTEPVSAPTDIDSDTYLGYFLDNDYNASPLVSVIDSYKLCDMYVLIDYKAVVKLIPVTAFNSEEILWYKVKAGMLLDYKILATVIEPGQELPTVQFPRTILFKSGKRFRWSYERNNVEWTTSLEEAIPQEDWPDIDETPVCALLDNVYSQLEEIFGPFPPEIVYE